MIARRAALLVAGCLLGGCGSPVPSVVVTLTTDLPACRLPAVRLRCAYDWDGLSARETASCEQVFYRGTSLAEVQLPASLGLRGDGSGRRLTLVVDDNGAAPTLRRIARLTFPTDGSEARLTVALRALCQEPQSSTAEHPCPTGSARCTRSQSCEQQGLTCGNDGSCRAVDVTAAELAAPPAAEVREAPGLCDAGPPRG